MCRWMWCRDCASAGYGVAAYVVSDDSDETFGVGDCVVARDEDAGYDDYGGGVGRGECEERKSRSD